MANSDTTTTLRDRTRSRHEALEATLRINRPGAGRAELTEYLSSMRGWLGPTNAHVWGRAWPRALEPRRRLSKVAWLDADLATLGAQPTACADAPASIGDDAPELLGMAYVIEGATLGGRVLGRRFHDVVDRPLRFFAGYGQRTGAMWTSMREALDELRTPAERERAAAAACHAFDDIARWMQATGAAT